ETLEIYSLKDGDKITPFESVLTVSGAYQQFGFLEGIIDGILSRRTSVATNVYNVVKPLAFLVNKNRSFLWAIAMIIIRNKLVTDMRHLWVELQPKRATR